MSTNVSFRFICEPKPSAHVVDMGRPLTNLVKWASVLQKVYGESIRFTSHNAEGEVMEIENDMIRFSDVDHQLTDWVPLGFYWDSFNRICRDMGYGFHCHVGDLEVEVETPDGLLDVSVPEIDFDYVAQETVYGNGKVEYSFDITEGTFGNTTMILKLEMVEIDNDDARKFSCEMLSVYKSKL